MKYETRPINDRMNDKTSFGTLLRSARHNNYTSVNEYHWRPIFELQVNNAVSVWREYHQNRVWFEDKEAIINKFIDLHKCNSYLEVGGQPFAGKRSTYHKVRCENKDSVNTDPTVEFEYELPDGSNHYVMTSDEFFKKIKDTKKLYDIVFIDAWHEHEQVLRDINNCLAHLSDNGTILLHDMIPLTRDLEKDPHRTGCCWRAFADLRATREDLDMSILVPPWGSEDSLGIIRKGSQKLFDKKLEYNFDFLLDNVEDLMNLIDLDTFYKKYIDNLDAE